MSRHHSHLNTAVQIISSARAGEPLAHHLKKFFSGNKKFGGSDRKSIASLCYNFFRLGKAMHDKSIEEKIIAANFLCNSAPTPFLENLHTALNEKIHWAIEKKPVHLQIDMNEIFPFSAELSPAIDNRAFAFSFFRQPFVYLRIRPGREVKILEQLSAAKIDFEEISTSCLALPPASKVQEPIRINKDVVVQDRSSQHVFDYILQDGVFLSKTPAVWDCCAASGGKAILLYDLLHRHLQLYVSDVRENILQNLRNRFKHAAIKHYHVFTADLTDENFKLPPRAYELIICDVPCTGSGTWARTPEQLYFFEKKEIEGYATLQKKIAMRAATTLLPDGIFFYITCSVFKKENEDIAAWLVQESGLQLLQMEYIKGFESRADTLFTAVLRRPPTE